MNTYDEPSEFSTTGPVGYIPTANLGSVAPPVSTEPRPYVVTKRRISGPFTSNFGPDIERLEKRAVALEAGDESSRARAHLVRELVLSMHNVMERAAMLAGRRHAVRQRPRANDLIIGGTA